MRTLLNFDDAVEPRTRLGSAWLRLSTGVKMMLILAVALLPLGAIAVLAAVESAQQNRAARQAEVRVIAGTAAGRLNAVIGRTAISMRATATAMAIDPSAPQACRRALLALRQALDPSLQVALEDRSGHAICSGPAFRPASVVLPPPGAAYRVGIDPVGTGLLLAIPDATETNVAVALIPRSLLANIVSRIPTPGPAQVTLVESGRQLRLSDVDGGAGGHVIVGGARLASGQLALQLSVPAPPLRPVELVTMLLPIVMLLAAATIGWLVLDQLILRPLARLQRAVAAYTPGGVLELPALTSTPSTEIRRLSQSFRELTDTVARHEGELEQGLARQTKLTREVHHRVKNNLQVVASLINLHARGAASPETIAAYASIQRRVDALAIVHRNHFAEYEQNRGVALRSLVQELAGNLRASSGGASGLTMMVAIEPLHVTQDTAVAVAFIITELVELAMLCGPTSTVAIRLSRAQPGHARLSITSLALVPSPLLDHWLGIRFGRVMEGLARQLRTRLDRNEDEGVYSLVIPTLD